MSEMVERVAKAIFGNSHAIGFWDKVDDHFRDFYKESARRAIKAMREPTTAQYDALSATNKLWKELNSEEVWKTYIDAALKSDHSKGFDELDSSQMTKYDRID